MSLLVGICGGSGSGKTTLAHIVSGNLGPAMAVDLAFDNYYRDQSDLTPAQRVAVNYDHPDSLDAELFAQHLEALRAGSEIAVPVYDFSTHTRTADVTIVEPKPVVVIEGILLLAYPEITGLFDLSVYRACPEELRFSRRLERDIAERGRTEESVRAQFEATVKPMHDQFVAPSADRADIVTTGPEPLEEAAFRVTHRIEQMLADQGIWLSEHGDVISDDISVMPDPGS